jgi:hypothetical protein
MTTEKGLPPRVQRVDVHPDGRVVLEFFGEAGRRIRAFDPAHAERGLADLDERPPHAEGERPPSAQKVFRESLVPSVLVGESIDDVTGVVTVRFTHKSGRDYSLVVETSSEPPRAVLLSHKGETARILVATGPRRSSDGRSFDKGQPYVTPTARARSSSVTDAVPTTPARPKARRSPLADARASLTAERKRLARLRRALEGDLTRHGDASRLARDGELMKGALGRVVRGVGELRLDDDDGTERVITLDPARSAVENMELLFKRARRARQAPQHVQPRIDDIVRRERALEQLLTDVDQALRPRPPASDDEDNSEQALVDSVRAFVAERSSGAGMRARPRHRRGERRPYRAFVGATDVRILVGRSARDNDELTFHIANGNDVWLHTRDAPGSHVVVRVPRDRMSPELLQDAAQLALWFSPLRGSRRGEVQFTSCKHVTKPGRNAAPGLVHVRDERVVHVAIDEERMKALLATELLDDEK